MGLGRRGGALLRRGLRGRVGRRLRLRSGGDVALEDGNGTKAPNYPRTRAPATEQRSRKLQPNPSAHDPSYPDRTPDYVRCSAPHSGAPQKQTDAADKPAYTARKPCTHTWNRSAPDPPHTPAS